MGAGVRGVQSKHPTRRSVWIISGTTQCVLSVIWKRKVDYVLFNIQQYSKNLRART